MSVARALRAAVRLLVQRPGRLLPPVLLSLGVLPAARIPLLAAVAIALTLLIRVGAVEPVVRAIGEIDLSDPQQGVSPELVEALQSLATPTVLALLAAGLVGALVVFLLGRAVAAAAALSAVAAGFDGEDPLTAGVAGMRVHWRDLLGVVVLRLALLALAVVPIALAVAIAAGGSLGTAGVVVTAAAGLVSLTLLVAVVVAFAFAGASVVVDDAGALGGLRNSAGFVRSNPATTVLYFVVSLGLVMAVGVAGVIANVAGASRLVAVISAFALAPISLGLTVGVYADAGLPAAETPPLRRRLGRAVRGGLASLGGFVRERPAANLLSAVLFGVGGALGYRATSRYGWVFDPPENVATVFGVVPVGPFLNIAANNWLVAVGTAYGGIAAGVPAAGGLLFNGALVGGLAGIADRGVFLALVVPHALLELPAIVVAGALGLRVGRVGLEWARGHRSDATLGAELRRALRVLVGLAVVLVVAAAIEAFVTPQVAALVLE